jgi:hypothetical protein
VTKIILVSSDIWISIRSTKYTLITKLTIQMKTNTQDEPIKLN